MLELKSISKAYQNKTVLHEISYKFKEGKIYVIKGVSGCGKTTMLNILGGLDTNYKGSYFYDSKLISNQENKDLNMYRQNIGYIYQNSLLLSNLTVLENLMFINNNEQAIMYYAEKLCVNHLLSKYPEQLSGGERQRISIIRALLNNPKLILADEPTASLDVKNSERISNLFAQISHKNNIIIIVTHENCFDNIADEIIYLNYGNIESVQQNTRENQISFNPIKCKTEKKRSKELLKYAFKRNKEKYKPTKLWITSLVVLILLICISVRLNFKQEYMNYVYQKYPINTFNICAEDYNALKESYDFFVYKNYTIDQKGMTCFPLFKEKDSGISYANAIEYGHFPNKENEIIVTKEFIRNIFKTKKYKDCVGKKVKIKADYYTVSGILLDLKENKNDSWFKKISKSDMYDMVYDNIYYDDEAKNAVFIPYQTISKKGHENSSNLLMVSLDLQNSPELRESLQEHLGGSISQWDEKINNAQSIINTVFIIILVAICIVALVALLFLKNEIQLELFYRSREIGYLQVFNVKKSEILLFLIFEKVLRTAFAVLYGVILFEICAIITYLGFGVNAFLNIYVLILIAFILLLYSIIVAWLPCRKFLKRSIISLIRNEH